MKNLIGISGKIGHGKDCVGNVLANLYDEESLMFLQGLTDSELIQQPIGVGDSGGYEIKKYASKLKDIVCLLIGCTREELENHEFKDTPLSDDWKLHHIEAGVGIINTYAEEVSKKRYVTLKEAEKAINEISPVNREIFEFKLSEESMTPRKLLQLLGTEAGRKIIHPNIWVNSLFSDYEPHSKWIITDVRFPNEAEAIKERGGIVIRVNRHFENVLIENDTWAVTDHQHPSETALDDYTGFDYVIENTAGLYLLIENVREIHNEIK